MEAHGQLVWNSAPPQGERTCRAPDSCPCSTIDALHGPISRRISVLLAQWVLNVLQFLTLLAVVWYTWEARRGSIRVARQYELEWKPQYHFSISGLDPTSGTGQILGSSDYPVELFANVVNLGRPALLVRGVALAPAGSVAVLANVAPLAVPAGGVTQFPVPIKPILDSLCVCELIPTNPETQNWRGKITASLWFEAGSETLQSKKQFFEVEFAKGKLLSLRQMTFTEFAYLERAPIDSAEHGKTTPGT